MKIFMGLLTALLLSMLGGASAGRPLLSAKDAEDHLLSLPGGGAKHPPENGAASRSPRRNQTLCYVGDTAKLEALLRYSYFFYPERSESLAYRMPALGSSTRSYPPPTKQNTWALICTAERRRKKRGCNSENVGVGG